MSQCNIAKKHELSLLKIKDILFGLIREIKLSKLKTPINSKSRLIDLIFKSIYMSNLCLGQIFNIMQEENNEKYCQPLKILFYTLQNLLKSSLETDQSLKINSQENQKILNTKTNFQNSKIRIKKLLTKKDMLSSIEKRYTQDFILHSSFLKTQPVQNEANYDFKTGKKLNTETNGLFKIDKKLNDEVEDLYNDIEKGLTNKLSKTKDLIVLIKLNQRYMKDIDKDNTKFIGTINKWIKKTDEQHCVKDNYLEIEGSLKTILRNLDLRTKNIEEFFYDDFDRSNKMNFEKFESHIYKKLVEGYYKIYESMLNKWDKMKIENQKEKGIQTEFNLQKLLNKNTTYVNEITKLNLMLKNLNYENYNLKKDMEEFKGYLEHIKNEKLMLNYNIKDLKKQIDETSKEKENINESFLYFENESKKNNILFQNCADNLNVFVKELDENYEKKEFFNEKDYFFGILTAFIKRLKKKKFIKGDFKLKTINLTDRDYDINLNNEDDLENKKTLITDEDNFSENLYKTNKGKDNLEKGEEKIYEKRIMEEMKQEKESEYRKQKKDEEDGEYREDGEDEINQNGEIIRKQKIEIFEEILLNNQRNNKISKNEYLKEKNNRKIKTEDRKEEKFKSLMTQQSQKTEIYNKSDFFENKNKIEKPSKLESLNKNIEKKLKTTSRIKMLIRKKLKIINSLKSRRKKKKKDFSELRSIKKKIVNNKSFSNKKEKNHDKNNSLSSKKKKNGNKNKSSNLKNEYKKITSDLKNETFNKHNDYNNKDDIKKINKKKINEKDFFKSKNSIYFKSNSKKEARAFSLTNLKNLQNYKSNEFIILLKHLKKEKNYKSTNCYNFSNLEKTKKENSFKEKYNTNVITNNLNKLYFKDDKEENSSKKNYFIKSAKNKNNPFHSSLKIIEGRRTDKFSSLNELKKILNCSGFNLKRKNMEIYNLKKKQQYNRHTDFRKDRNLKDKEKLEKICSTNKSMMIQTKNKFFKLSQSAKKKNSDNKSIKILNFNLKKLIFEGTNLVQNNFKKKFYKKKGLKNFKNNEELLKRKLMRNLNFFFLKKKGEILKKEKNEIFDIIDLFSKVHSICASPCNHINKFINHIDEFLDLYQNDKKYNKVSFFDFHKYDYALPKKKGFLANIN